MSMISHGPIHGGDNLSDLHRLTFSSCNKTPTENNGILTSRYSLLRSFYDLKLNFAVW